jgi:hypothetical protein
MVKFGYMVRKEMADTAMGAKIIFQIFTAGFHHAHSS